MLCRIILEYITGDGVISKIWLQARRFWLFAWPLLLVKPPGSFSQSPPTRFSQTPHSGRVGHSGWMKTNGELLFTPTNFHSSKFMILIRVALHGDPKLGDLVHGAGERPGARCKGAIAGACEVLDQGTLRGR